MAKIHVPGSRFGSNQSRNFDAKLSARKLFACLWQAVPKLCQCARCDTRGLDDLIPLNLLETLER